MPVSPDVLQRLKHPDPAVRRQAIIEAGRSLDLAAMPALRDVFQHDPDPALRDLARKAGLNIREKASAAPPPPARPAIEEPDLDRLTAVPATPRRTSLPGSEIDDPDIAVIMSAASTGFIPPDVKAEPLFPQAEAAPAAPAEEAHVGPVRGRKYTVSPENVKRAKHYTEQALSQAEDRQNDKAMNSLAQAISLNPNLVNDAYYMNVAARVTNLEGDGAIRMIVDSGQRRTFVKTQEKQRRNERVRRQRETAQASGWDDALFELALFALIGFVGSILSVIITQQALRQVAGSPEFAALADRETRQQIEGILAITFVAALGTAGVSVVGQVLGIMFQNVFIHIGARLLGRIGTYTHLLTLMLRVYNRWLPILLGLGIAFSYLGIITFGSPIVLCLAIGVFGVSLYMSFKLVAAIGQAYDGGFGLGCGLFILAVVIQLAITAAIAFILVNAFGLGLNTLLPDGFAFTPEAFVFRPEAFVFTGTGV
jgi:hypothetical protein